MAIKKLTPTQMSKAKELCRELPLIEVKLREAGLYETVTKMNAVVKSVGYETANKSPF